MRDFMSPERLAKRWDVSYWTALRRCKRDLPCHKIGGLLRIDLADVEAYEAARRRGVGPAPRRVGR